MQTSLLWECGYVLHREEIFFAAKKSYATMPGCGRGGGGIAGINNLDVGCLSVVAGIALFSRTLRKTNAATRMTIIAMAAAMTTGRKLESPVRSSGVGSLFEGCGSLIQGWMRKPVQEVIRASVIRRGQGGT
jgi:hypothetical protein